MQDLGIFPSELPEIGRGRQAPDIAGKPDPDLGPLRAVTVPRPRFEIAEFFVGHAIEIEEQFDDLSIRIAMVDRDIVAGSVPDRPPQDLDSVAPSKSQARCICEASRSSKAI